MKKYLFVLIFAVMAGGFAPRAAAQLSWSFDADINTGLVAWNIPTGERARDTITVNNVPFPNTAGYNPVGDRGDYTHTAGNLEAFTYGSGNWLRQNALRFTFDMHYNTVDFHLRTLLDPLVANVTTIPNNMNNITGDHSFVMGDGRTSNWSDLLRFSFDEWYAKGVAGFLTGYVGNTPDRGSVDEFAVFTDDLLRTIKVDYFGINTPTADAGFSGMGQDANNFMSRPSIEPGAVDPFNWVMPYFSIGLGLSVGKGADSFPLFIQVAADPGNNTGIGNGNGGNDYYRYNGGVRVTAEEIAGALTFNLLYRIRGGNPNISDGYHPIYDPNGQIQPNGLGKTAHTFGLYANVLAVPDLGIGLGYSGYVVNYEDDANTRKGPDGTEAVLTKRGPLYNGIDLRLQYTGLEKITITSHNNVSFALSNYSTDTDTFYSVLGTPNGYYNADGWFALYNALGADFTVTGQLSVSVQIANRYGLLTAKESMLGGGFSTIKRSRNLLGGGAYAAFQFNSSLNFQGGLAFRHTNDSYSNDLPGSQNDFDRRSAGGGAFEIAIPIRMNITFRGGR